MTIVPFNPGPKSEAVAHNNRGVALHEEGDIEGALAEYRQAISIDPSYANAHFNLGLAHHDQGRIDLAIASYREALRLDPTDPEAHLNLGAALRRRAWPRTPRTLS